MRAAILTFMIDEKTGMKLRVSCNPEHVVIQEQPDSNPIVTIGGQWYLSPATGKPAVLDMTFDEAMAEHTNALNAPTMPLMKVVTVPNQVSSIMDIEDPDD